MNRWTITLEEDPTTGELVLPLTDEMLDLAGFTIGDTLIWTKVDNESWTLTKKKEDDGTSTDTTK